MKAPMIINIGWARAASTALRQNFLGRHPHLVAAGRNQPEQEGPAAAILRAIKTLDDAQFRREIPGLKSIWSDYVDRTDGLVCLTDEELSIGLPGRIGPAALARRCAILFPEARILAVVREQHDAIGSFYGLSQRTVFGDSTPFPDWLNRHFINPEKGQGFAYLYSHAATLRAYGEGRSRSDILTLPYDRLRDDAPGAYASIARWMAVDEPACAELPNARLNASPNGHPPWTAVSAAAIGALYEADNRALAEEFGVTFLRSTSGERKTPDAV